MDNNSMGLVRLLSFFGISFFAFFVVFAEN
jgi:hypothetical protein